MMKWVRICETSFFFFFLSTLKKWRTEPAHVEGILSHIIDARQRSPSLLLLTVDDVIWRRRNRRRRGTWRKGGTYGWWRSRKRFRWWYGLDTNRRPGSDDVIIIIIVVVVLVVCGYDDIRRYRHHCRMIINSTIIRTGLFLLLRLQHCVTINHPRYSGCKKLPTVFSPPFVYTVPKGVEEKSADDEEDDKNTTKNCVERENKNSRLNYIQPRSLVVLLSWIWFQHRKSVNSGGRHTSDLMLLLEPTPDRWLACGGPGQNVQIQTKERTPSSDIATHWEVLKKEEEEAFTKRWAVLDTRHMTQTGERSRTHFKSPLLVCVLVFLIEIRINKKFKF